MTRHRDSGERVFRALLRLYPPAFRRRFGDEMVEFFAARRVEQYQRGRSSARLWMYLLADIALNAPLLHVHALVARRAALRPVTSRDVPWSSPEYPAETHPMDTLRQDVAYGVRTLLRRPGFAAVAILTLALGIGATTAIYSVVDAVLLRPLPWPSGDRLVFISETRDGVNQGGVSYIDYLDWRANSRTLEEMSIIRGQSVNLTGGDAPDRVIGTFTNASTFRLLGASAQVGRLFTDAETIAGAAPPVAIISDGFWRSHFGGRRDAVGQTLVLNGTPCTVIGVLRPGTQVPFGAPDVWLPIGHYSNKGDLTIRGRPGVWVLARLKRDASLGNAQADLRGIASRLAEEYPPTNAGVSTQIDPLKEQLVGSSRAQILMVLGAVGIVLLIACANVANLQLARAASRRRELSVRSALGAGRARLIRQMITENLLLSIAGGATGLLIAYAGTRWLASVVPNFVQFSNPIGLDVSVLAFAAIVTIATGFIFGLPSAWRASRVRLQDALTLRTSGASGGRLQRSVLIPAQMALCVVLLITAGLLTRSLVALSSVQPGFDPDQVLTMQFRLPPAKYDTEDKIATMFTRSLEELRAVPGVKSAALVRATPLNGNGQTVPYQIAESADPAHLPQAQFNIVSSGYFSTMRIPLVAGRDFTANDRTGSVAVVVVNAQLAKKIAPAGSALGARVKIATGPGSIWATVIGVVGNAKHFQVSEEQLDQLYASYLQSPLIFTEVVVRSAGDPSAIANAARAAIWRVDRDQPVWRVRPLVQSIQAQLGPRGFILRLLATFAILAVVLAMIGIYGVTSYAVAGRTQEMGIRMALGARATEVVTLIVRESMTTIAVAILVGLGAAYGVTRLIQSQLFGISATDPAIYAIVPVLLAAVAALACWVPARRASRVDPVATLKAD
jgi:putative ABC transport system permease protein